MTAPTFPLAAIDLHFDDGVVLARQRARDVAELLGFDRQSQTRIATAVSELARNAHRYARGGRVVLGVADGALTVEVADQGGGIADLDAVLSGRYRSATGMGQGLIGVRRLMDDFDVRTSPAAGTTVRVSKALPPGAALGDADLRRMRDELARRSSRSPFEEVQSQNQELLQALGELRSRQDELVQLNRELDETNRGVVALYAELDDRAEQLRDADEKKSRFLADMSHELRSPLNSIIALADLLADGPDPLTAEQRTQVDFIRKMAGDQLRLVGDLLDLAKIEAGRVDVDLRRVSLPELLAGLRLQMRPLAARAGVALRLVSDPDVPELVTDDAKLVQVLRNLVSNALKYTEDGEVVVTARAAGDDVEVSVRDTGIGIPADQLEHIFEEFAQVPGEHQRRVQGTGLGLPLTRKLAGVLGGSVRVESEVGAGSLFVVCIPVRHPAAVAAEAPPRADAEAAPAGEPWARTVLVVDDDAASRHVVRQHLAGVTEAILEAEGGLAALSMAEQRPPGAIVLDLAMPDLSGFEVLERLRTVPALAAVPIVVHTSKALEPADRERIARADAMVLDKAGASHAALLQALGEAAEAVRRG